VIDGDPGGEEGTYVRSGMKVLQNMKRLAAYARPTAIEDFSTWILTKGPVTVGTDWYESMFTLTADHRAQIDESVICPETVKPVAGRTLLPGARLRCGPPESRIRVPQLVGSSWGANEHFYLSRADLKYLVFSDGGEAWCALELP